MLLLSETLKDSQWEYKSDFYFWYAIHAPLNLTESCQVCLEQKIPETIYIDIGKMSSFLNKFLQETLDSTPDIILITFFCNLKTLHMFDELSQNSILYLMTE